MQIHLSFVCSGHPIIKWIFKGSILTTSFPAPNYETNFKALLRKVMNHLKPTIEKLHQKKSSLLVLFIL